MIKTKNSVGRRVVVVLGALVLISGSAFATAIGTGESNTAGTVNVSTGGITFSGFTPTLPLTTSQLGSFTGTTTVTQGSLSGPPTLNPNLTAWATFTGAVPGPITFDLLTINPGAGSAVQCLSNTVGNECTPSGTSGITIFQVTPTQVIISLTGTGIAYTGSSASGSSAAVVSFSSQNNIPGTITSILQAVNSPGGFSNSVSATYDTASAIPEPMTFSMLGVGLLGLGLLRRHKRS
jgi:hypothetical protein